MGQTAQPGFRGAQGQTRQQAMQPGQSASPGWQRFGGGSPTAGQRQAPHQRRWWGERVRRGDSIDRPDDRGQRDPVCGAGSNEQPLRNRIGRIKLDLPKHDPSVIQIIQDLKSVNRNEQIKK